jgi:transposase-like protein
MSIAEGSRRHEIHPNLIRKWQELHEKQGDQAFAGHDKVYREEANVAALERKIGQLSMETTNNAV